MFVNTHGASRLVAPWGGVERRLSANPIAAGIPRASGPPIVLDVSTCTIAEGKVRSYLFANKPVPPGCITDAHGQPTTDAAKFYGPPPGALLPIAEHKGFGLGLVADILAGALSGAGCTRPGVDRVGNSFLVTVIDVDRVRGASDFEVGRRQPSRVCQEQPVGRGLHGDPGAWRTGDPRTRASPKQRHPNP